MLLYVAFEPHEAEHGAALAQALGMEFDLLLLTGSPPDVGARKWLGANLADIPPADGLAPEVARLACEYAVIAATSSMTSKDVMPRIAGLLDAAMVTDVIGVESPTRFRRPVVAGAAIATVETLASPVVLTVRPSGFPVPPPAPNRSGEAIALSPQAKARRVSATTGGGGRPDLTQANVIVSGGRPLRDRQTFETVIGGLADALGGAVGATRAAVDSGIAPNELQVGQTGKVVAPDLYIAAGISGSTQHMAGIKDSRLIVAINKDPDAPIFEFADLGLVADLFEAIPAILAKLGK